MESAGLENHMTRAARQPSVRIACALAVLLVTGSPARAQQAPGPADSSRPFEISDNSFLVEEALNQEPGVFQNIFNVGIDRGDAWVATFTQEWPLISRMHQISYTLPYAALGTTTGMGDAAVHYRLQLLAGEDGRLAFSPRISLIVPTARPSSGLGRAHAGWEVNLPFSQQVRDVYLHWNAGFTHVPGTDTGSALMPRVSASSVWRVRPMVNLMLEGVGEWAADDEALASSRRHSRVTISPGVRTGWNIGNAQTIIGVGLPITFSQGSHSTAAFLYLSHELEFKGSK